VNHLKLRSELQLKSELAMTEFLQVALTLKEEKSDSGAQAVHRRSSQSASPRILPGIAERRPGARQVGD
jgi:hypothetical protein